MRHGSAGRRNRHRGNGNGGGHNNNNGGGQRRGGNSNRMQVFDSNGPGVRIRGTAFQITEKYLALAKDAASMGDRIMYENYLQHAEHYQRIINIWMEENRGNEQYYNDRSQQQTQGQQPVDGNVREESEAVVSSSDGLGLPQSILGARQTQTQSGDLETAE